MTSPPRVRFSPAPTGSLHVGSARTALFNYLFARHHGGTFCLRIEDTDRERSRGEWVVGIQDSLRWLGLEWDEGPVLQSTRTQEYLAAADDLLAAGNAYDCFCTSDEVKARADAAKAAGRPPGYDGHCRDLTLEQRSALAADGRPRSIRFRTPDDGVSHFVDAIRGDVRVEWALISDFVIVRSDGNPIFFLANAVDDLAMGITHVIRGEDLIDSTHRVLALRDALGATERPVYAHLPLILGPDRAKLSKRHGAVALEEFRDEGYLPEAMVNYLSLLGWAPDDGREVMDVDEIIAAFDLDGVTHAAAAFDHAKLDWMNGQWIRGLTLPEFESQAFPLARARFGEALDVELLREALRIGQERAVTIGDLLAQAEFLFVSDDEFAIAKESWAVVEKTERVAELFDAVTTYIEGCEIPVDADEFLSVVKGLDLKPRKAMPALYAAIEGRHAGLPLFDSIGLLGRERTLARLRGTGPAHGVNHRLRLVVGTVAVIAAVLVGYYVVTVVQVWRAARHDGARPAEAIIVLGAAQYNGRPSPVFRARLDHAADLYERGIAPLVVVTGGKIPGDTFTEAGAGADYLHTRGVPDDAILRETTSRNSWESLRASARFLKARDVDRVVLVSDPFHSLRIRLIAEELGFDATTSPTRTSPISGFSEWMRIFSEGLRVAAGRIFGFGRLDRATRVRTLGSGLTIGEARGGYPTRH